jgi:putative membrane-bound dehydrogenase-like protein
MSFLSPLGRVGATLFVLLALLGSRPQDLGTPPQEAVKLMTVPPGFKAHLFAGEPDIKQPNAFAIDDRGRLWVAENFTYAGPGGPWKPSGRDTILVFEDTTGRGTFDKRTVFMNTLSFISGLEVGFGGVWVGSPPNLLFIPIKEGELKPAGPPQVVLDGWGHHDQHETLNSFIWGPDGWLYGCHGVFTHSNVGKPGAPDSERMPVNAAIWRYHPTRKIFESFAEGTSNPWGVDFDDYGQAFIEACVIPHLWYVIQGGRYHRQGGQHFNKFTFEDIKTIADHRHENLKGRKGGHAHGGARFVLNDVFPPEYRGKFIIGTIHHHGMYTEAFERQGSGFVGKHVDDFMMANDLLYLGFNHEFGPDGALYVIDWYDPKPCHGQTPEHIDTGRIYKITYGDSKKVSVDLASLASADLVKLQESPNDWYVRHARRLLQERGPDPAVHKGLLEILKSSPEVPKKLRALWALHVTGGLTEPILLGLLHHEHEYVRGWAIQFLVEDRRASEGALQEFARLAKEDPSPAVRLYLAAALQRLPLKDRWGILEGLVAHAEDANDHNLPLMLWYAAEPLVPLDGARALKLAALGKIPKLREFVTRRLVASASSTGPIAPRATPAKAVSSDDLILWLRPPATGSPVAEWTDESAGAHKALQPVEAARPEGASKVAGRACVRFNGKDDHLVVTPSADLSFRAGDSFSISAWVHLSSVPQDGWRGVITKSRDAQPWYGIWIDGEGRWAFGGPKNLFGCPAVPGWQHLLAVQEVGKGRKLYVNGQLAGTGPSLDASGPGDLWLGGAKTTGEYFAGSLGEVRIYRRALDASEAAYLALNP